MLSPFASVQKILTLSAHLQNKDTVTVQTECILWGFICLLVKGENSLQFYFLGLLEIYSDNQLLVKPPTLKSQSVLAYLVYHRSRPQFRDQLAGIFFGERTEHKARRSLSTALWHIHRCLTEKANILSDSQTVQFDHQNKIWLDVREFEVKAAC
jgi:DNA-binding SARP family transcriptional activator